VLPLELGGAGEPLRILCLGAHCDDIEIGCGGAILRLAQLGREVVVHWVVFSSDEVRAAEAQASAEDFLAGVTISKVVIKRFRDCYFPYIGGEIKDFFGEIRQGFSPDLVLTHYREDRHQDHRLISDLTWNTFRNHLILEYEVPKYDGDLSAPNVFFPLSRELGQRKIALLMKHFGSQHARQWFSEDTFHALLRLRGVEASAPEGLAEAFYCRKAVL
jgi:LmbE family N-acetylglucosaminyl deacetylase